MFQIGDRVRFGDEPGIAIVRAAQGARVLSLGLCGFTDVKLVARAVQNPASTKERF